MSTRRNLFSFLIMILLLIPPCCAYGQALGKSHAQEFGDKAVARMKNIPHLSTVQQELIKTHAEAFANTLDSINKLTTLDIKGKQKLNSEAHTLYQSSLMSTLTKQQIQWLEKKQKELKNASGASNN